MEKGKQMECAFLFKTELKHPPSLVNIFKELNTDLGNAVPVSGDLSHWAKQGVLLLNATLTVRESEAGSHQKQGWEQFTDAVIAKISEQKAKMLYFYYGEALRRKKEKKLIPLNMKS